MPSPRDKSYYADLNQKYDDCRRGKANLHGGAHSLHGRTLQWDVSVGENDPKDTQE